MLEDANQKEIRALNFLLEITEKSKCFTSDQIKQLFFESAELIGFEGRLLRIFNKIFPSENFKEKEKREKLQETPQLTLKHTETKNEFKEEKLMNQIIVTQQKLQSAINTEFLGSTLNTNQESPFFDAQISPLKQDLITNTPVAVGIPRKYNNYNSLCSRSNSFNRIDFNSEEFNSNYLKRGFQDVSRQKIILI